MRLKTIWTLDAMSLTERLLRTRDWGAAAVASKLPRRLRYFVVMGELGYITTILPGDVEIPAIPLSDILSNIRTPKRLS